MPLTFRQIRYFVTAVEACSISRASEELHVAPTALSQQIKALESNLGARLLDRHSRGIAPTEPGKELYRRGRQILDLIADTEAAVSRLQKLPPRLILLGMPPTIARLIGSEAILGTAKRFDNFCLNVVEGWSDDVFERMLSGEIDYAIGYNLVSRQGVTTIDLVDERFAFAAASSASVSDAPITLEDALSHELVFYGRKSATWRAVCAAAEAIGVAPSVFREVTSVEVWRDLVTRGLAAAIIPIGALGSEIASGTVVAREIIGGPVHLRIGLAARHDVFRTDILTGFVPFLQDVVARRYRRFENRFTTLLPVQ